MRAVRAQARAQPIDQQRAVVQRLARVAGEQRRALLPIFLEPAGVQFDALDRPRERLAIHPLAQQIEEAARVAVRQRRLDTQHARRLAPVTQLPGRLAHGRAACLQKGAQLQQLPARGEQQRLGVDHRIGEVQHGSEALGRLEAGARIGAQAQGAIHVLHQRGAEAPCEPGARQTQEVAQRANPEITQLGALVRRHLERGQRQRVQGRAQGIGIAHDDVPAGARQPFGAGRCRRDGQRGGVAEAAHLGMQALQQALRAAEEPQAALDLQQYRVRRSEAYHRCVGDGERSQVFERGPFRPLVAAVYVQSRDQRVRGRQGEAGVDAAARGRRVGAQHPRTAALLLGDDGGQRTPARARVHLDRKLRQMQCKPEHVRSPDESLFRM
ncbi:MAG: hypothetical protein NFCOHLIN_03245 [Gammaproteobacteria bacterium]|nr:hypothetical protein [Gammaproteobacteria bacterium]